MTESKITPQEKKELIEKYKEGSRKSDLAKEYGISPSRVAHIISRSRVPIRKGVGSRWTPEEETYIKEGYFLKQMSVTEIAENLSRNGGAVRDRLRKLTGIKDIPELETLLSRGLNEERKKEIKPNRRGRNKEED